MSFLSSLNRRQIMRQLQSDTFHLAVIGGGITGAGIALDAASRGMKVALVEMDDFASGTSSRSTKLIHGGLRYLKQLELGLVREVGQERAIVHRLAPHLAIPEKMLLPLTRGGPLGPVPASLGLWVYDQLAGVRGDDKRRMLNKAQTLALEPLLNGQEGALLGSGYYAEYRTDDARLTIENIKTAVQYGATCLNYVKATGLAYEDGRVVGVHCEDKLTDTAFDIRAFSAVSAAGPWADELRKADKSLDGKRVFLSKGIHIVVPYERLPLRQSVYFDAPGGRMVFAIPRLRATYIGTTDTPYHGPNDDIPIYREEVLYLLNAANNMFSKAALELGDIESSWAGLRPLIYEENKPASEMSRKDELFESPSGLLTIAGGKLTGYRRMAKRVVGRVARMLKQRQGISFQPCHTDAIPLTGGPFADMQEVRAFQGAIAARAGAAYGLGDYHAAYLVANYGRQADIILNRMAANTGDAEVSLARAEAWFTIHHELAARPLDLFNRRTGRLYFNLPGMEGVLAPVLKDFQEYFGWTDEQLAREKAIVEQAMYRAAHFEREQQG
ncbi:MAG: glycerol-3-phosphate dehydrogenase/oxidase [Phaeodactylibacter sp.]|nr:glycerol-3-phosphate dehydrogenase/oxidase [Phaeodactylibacter sp.]